MIGFYSSFSLSILNIGSPFLRWNFTSIVNNNNNNKPHSNVNVWKFNLKKKKDLEEKKTKLKSFLFLIVIGLLGSVYKDFAICDIQVRNRSPI